MLFAALAVFWLVLFVPAVKALVAGVPDTYHNEHWRSVTLIGGSLLLAVSMVITKRWVQYVLITATLAVLLVGQSLAR